MTTEFIACDFCGWNEGYYRFTHVPRGATLVELSELTQREWDQAKLNFLTTYEGRGINMYFCENSYSIEGGRLMGSVDEVCARIRARLDAP